MAQLKALNEAVAAQRERQLAELITLEKDKHQQEMGQAKASRPPAPRPSPLVPGITVRVLTTHLAPLRCLA